MSHYPKRAPQEIDNLEEAVQAVEKEWGLKPGSLDRSRIVLVPEDQVESDDSETLESNEQVAITARFAQHLDELSKKDQS